MLLPYVVYRCVRACVFYYCAFQRTIVCMYTYMYIHIYIYCIVRSISMERKRSDIEKREDFRESFFSYTHVRSPTRSRLRVSNLAFSIVESHTVFSLTSFSRLVRRTCFPATRIVRSNASINFIDNTHYLFLKI